MDILMGFFGTWAWVLSVLYFLSPAEHELHADVSLAEVLLLLLLHWQRCFVVGIKSRKTACGLRLYSSRVVLPEFMCARCGIAPNRASTRVSVQCARGLQCPFVFRYAYYTATDLALVRTNRIWTEPTSNIQARRWGVQMYFDVYCSFEADMLEHLVASALRNAMDLRSLPRRRFQMKGDVTESARARSYFFS